MLSVRTFFREHFYKICVIKKICSSEVSENKQEAYHEKDPSLKKKSRLSPPGFYCGLVIMVITLGSYPRVEGSIPTPATNIKTASD